MDDEDKPNSEYQSNPSVWTTSPAALPQKLNSNQHLRDFEAKSNQQLRDFEAKSIQQLRDFEASSNLQLRGSETNSKQQSGRFEANSTHQSPIIKNKTEKHSIVDDEDKPYSEYQSNPNVWTTSSAPLQQITVHQEFSGFEGNTKQQWGRSEENSNQQLSGFKEYPQNQQLDGFIANPQNPYMVAPEQMTMDERPPHDFMHRAICVTICCFWPTGIVAILKASEARNAYARGDIEAAKRSTHEAHQMSNISILIGLASFLLVLIIVGILIGTGN
ncbi:uncharacterized protein LOC128156492 [Crassostrea angulata]|uniref:uncharacterized protein LOC128156492 n=1 Tax=Magallana angulata TaxID=2784310 RepID=UPI0022B0EE6F|nr:uncharacterized protein LOC128156492 [Crassostrea angulata]